MANWPSFYPNGLVCAGWSPYLMSRAKPTIAAQNADAQKQAQDEAEFDPLVRAVKKAFPSARIKQVKELKPAVETGLIDYDDEAGMNPPEE